MLSDLVPIIDGRVDSGKFRITTLRFGHVPVAGVSTYCTLGMSDHVLVDADGAACRHELMTVAYDTFAADDLASFLVSLADSIVNKHVALHRGEVLGPCDPIVPFAHVRAVYMSLPVIFPDEFMRPTHPMDPATSIVWALPITAEEAEFVRSYGWSEFEAALEADDRCDFFNLNRPSVAGLAARRVE